MDWSLTLTSPTSSGLVPNNSYPGWAKLTRIFISRAVHFRRRRLLATSVSSTSSWRLTRTLALARGRVSIISVTFDKSDRSLQLLVHAFMTSRLDYCNGLFANCSVAVRQRLQRMQNSAARLVCSEAAFSHAAPLLHSLHWLPVARRITYKLCVLTFDVYHGTAPAYITDLCSRCSDDRLRSSARGHFLVRTRTRFANSWFTVAGPAAWNSLPAHIRSPDDWFTLCVLPSSKNLFVYCSWLT